MQLLPVLTVRQRTLNASFLSSPASAGQRTALPRPPAVLLVAVVPLARHHPVLAASRSGGIYRPVTNRTSLADYEDVMEMSDEDFLKFENTFLK